MRSPHTPSTGSRAPKDVSGGVSGALAKITPEYSIIGWKRLSGNMRSPAPVRTWSGMANRRWPWLSRGARTNIYPKLKVAVMTLLHCLLTRERNHIAQRTRLRSIGEQLVHVRSG